jgi:PII-like signaling protein
MEVNMWLPEEGCLLRVFIGESDKHAGKPLYEWIVLQAREAGLVTLEKAQINFYRANHK